MLNLQKHHRVIEWTSRKKNAKGWIVIDTLINNVSGGGLFMHKNASLQEVSDLASTMSYKNQLQIPAFGGSKAGICFDHEDPDSIDVLTEFLHDHKELLNEIWCTGGDLNVSNEIIQGIVTKTLNLSSPFVSLSKMLSSSFGIFPEEGQLPKIIQTEATPFFSLGGGATGYSVAQTIKFFVNKKVDVLIQGFGMVGSSLACYLSTEKIANVVGICEKDCFVFAQDGIDVIELLNIRKTLTSQEKKNDLNSILESVDRKKYQIIKRSIHQTDEDFLCQFLEQGKGMDVFCPCATRYSVTEKVATILNSLAVHRSIHIISGANNIFSGKAKDILDRNLITMIPEWVSNCGNALLFMESLKQSHFDKNCSEQILLKIKTRLLTFLNKAKACMNSNIKCDWYNACHVIIDRNLLNWDAPCVVDLVSDSKAKDFINVAEYILNSFECDGIEYVFGIPGGYINPFLKIFEERKGIKFIVGRHEEGSAFMADGYARVSGKLGVVLTTAGPAATNALTGVACAQMDKSQLMLITGHTSTTTIGKGALQDSTNLGINIVEMFRHTCGLSEMAMTVATFPHLFSRALKISCGVPKQATHICLPLNISSAKLSSEVSAEEYKPQISTSGSYLDHKKISHISKLISNAKTPVFFLGNGCQSALKNKELVEAFCNFVEREGIAVITSPKAKGLFPETHPCSLRVFGLGGSNYSETFLTEFPPDILIVLGSSLNEWATARWDKKLQPTQAMVQVDIDPTVVGRNYKTQYSVISDIECFLKALLSSAEGPPAEEKVIDSRIEKIQKIKKDNFPFNDWEKAHSDQLPIKPQKALQELSEFARGKKIHFFLDMGSCTAYFSNIMQLDPPSRVYAPYGFTSMGWANGAVIGGKLAAPNVPCICVTGDGSFLMNGVEIQSAAKHSVGAVYFVLNDNYYGSVHHGMASLMSKNNPSNQAIHQESNSYSFGSLDLVKFSESLGATCYLVEKPEQITSVLSLACNNADAYNKPQVIIIKTDYREMPPFASRNDSLREFKNE